MLKRTVRRGYLLALITLFCAGPAAAQTSTATIRGQVTDSASQRPLGGAEVFVVTDGVAGVTRTARTNASGQYTIAAVPVGPVTVRVRLVGYAPKGRRLTIREGEITTADFVLGD